MSQDDERLERLARILEETVASGASFATLDVDSHREALGTDVAELAGLVEVERRLEAFMEPPDSVRLPRRLGAWTLLRELGRGGMGVVYEAAHRESGRRAAVKVLRLGFVGRADARARFRREAEALARVRHPNIVEFLEAGEAEEQPFYVMALVDGVSLDEALRRGERPEWPVLSARLAEVADALHRLHEAGLVHRDLKPSNIVIAQDGRMLLADFGLATGDDLLTLTRTGDALGTPAYMSPEQVLGRHDDVDARSDVYGLGATLYYALTGHAPIEAEDAHSLATAILRQRPAAPHTHAADVPRALERIALKSLEKARADRYPTVAAMRDDLQAFAGGNSVGGRPVPALVRGTRVARRHPLVVAGSVAVLGLVAFLLLRTTPASLHLDVVPAAAVLVDGRAVGQSPVENLALEPGVRQITLRPVDSRFRAREETLVAEEGAVYRLQWVLEPKDVGDWDSVATLAHAIGVPFERPTAPSTRRAGRVPEVQLVFPRGALRPRDLAAAPLRIDVAGRLDGDARIVFLRGGEVVGVVEPWVPTALTNAIELPPALVAELAAGGVFTWRLERESEVRAEAEFEIVAEDAADAALARLGAATSDDDALLHTILEARVLLNAGLPLAAWQAVRARVESGAENVLLLALEQESLEALFPSEKERAALRPWRSVLERLGDAERYSDAQRARVFGPQGD